MTLWENLLVIGILIGIFILLYCKMKNVSLKEFFLEIKDILNTDKGGT